MRVSTFILASALLAACGATTPRVNDGPPLAIEALRARVRANPADADAARALAMGELLEDGGDAARAREAIDRAITLRQEDPALHFISGLEHEQHGRIEESFAADLAAIDAARNSDAAYASAVAEVAIGYAGARETDVHDWRTRFEAVLRRAVDEPGRLAMPARLRAAFRLRGLLARRGEIDASEAVLEGLGCLSEVRAAGPFGPHPMLRFDTPTPAEGTGPLAERYEVGGSLGERPTRALESKTCGFNLGGDRRAPGVWVVERILDVPESGDHVLYVRTPNAFRVSVDGRSVGGVDRRTLTGPAALYFPVELTAGEHEIELVLTSRHGSPFVGLALALASGDPRGLEIPGASDDWFGRLVRVHVSRARGDALGAREAALALDGTHATATRLIALADAISGDPHRPPEERRDHSRQLLERAAAADPDAWYPLFRAARTAQDPREALALLRAVVERFEATPSLQLDLASTLRERGDVTAADAALARAVELVPSCAALDAELAALRARGRVAEADARLDEVLACDARSTARMALLRRQRRWDEARSELERLTPLLSDAQVRSARGGIARATGDEETLTAIRTAVAAEHERTVIEEYPSLHVDTLLAAGHRAEAMHAIDEGIERDPGRWSSLRRVRRALTGRDDLLQFRLDGAEAIERFEASGRTYEGAAQVLVLDYMVIRVSEDGSSESLVHQIYRVQSEEAIESLGQLSMPGYVLTLRSIKPDGRRLEPDAIAGLDHIEMPSLAIGDYVEYEYIRSSGSTFNGGYRSSGWVFQDFTSPFDLSQIVLVAPHDMDIHVEARGPVPESTTRRDGDLSVTTWTVEESRPLTAEPDGATSPERLPGIDFGIRATWDAFFDRTVDGLMDRTPRDPAVDRLVAEILGERRGSEIETARRLHRWVLENIEPGSGTGVVPRQIAARTGGQAQILSHMLRVAGIDARIVLARTLGGRSPMELFRSDVYTASLVMIRPEGGGDPFFTAIGDRAVPFGYVPASIRGQQAMVLEPGRPTVVVSAGATEDRIDVSVDLAMTRQGGARVTIEERHSGASGYFWRGQLEGIPAAELADRFHEGYVSRMFPQSRLVDLRFEGRDDPDAPLLMRYEVEAPAVGRAAGPGVLLAPLFALGPARTLAALPSRETTEVVFGMRQRVVVRVTAPGRAAPRTIEDVSLDGPEGARASWRSRVEGNTLTVERELQIDPRLVTPPQYADFASFCRNATQVEHAEILVPLR